MSSDFDLRSLVQQIAADSKAPAGDLGEDAIKELLS